MPWCKRGRWPMIGRCRSSGRSRRVRSISRSRPRAPAAGARASRSARRAGPALDARLDLPAGVPLGLPADMPDGLLQLEWCAPFSGVVRDALHQLKYGGERRLADPLGGADRPALGAGRRRRRRAGARCRSTATAPRSAATTRRTCWPGRPAPSLGLPVVEALERWQATTAQFQLDRRARAANVAGAFRRRSDRRRIERDPRSLGRPRRRRHDHRRDAVGVRDGAARGGAPAVSAVTVARER